MTAHITLQHVQWAAEECHWQQSGERSVAWMLAGWQFVIDENPMVWDDIDVDFLLELGAIVEPRHNRAGFRTVGVRVGMDVKMNPTQVPSSIDKWLMRLPDMNPTEAFHIYEEIHPFRDGNGRTGSILFNFLNDTMLEPVHPPNLWDDPRRYEGPIRD